MELVHNVVEPASPRAVIIPGNPDLLFRFWPFIREGLARIKRLPGQKERSTWEPEHVLRALKASYAAMSRGEEPLNELWLGMVGESPVAFSVTQASLDPFLNIPLGMFVWMAYKKGFTDEAGVVEEMDTFLSNMARARGYRYLEAYTTRPALGPRLEKQGWERVLFVIRKDLYPKGV